MTPWGPPDDCCSNNNYIAGLILLFFYGGSATFWSLTKNHTCLGVLFRLITIFFLILNGWYITVFMPRIIDAAKYNGTVYYLVSYSTWPDSPWTIYQLTKWRGAFKYEIQAMPDRWVWKGRLFYDKKTNLVNIVTVFDDRNHLLYTDDTPPRYYEHDSRQLGNHLYYVSSQCKYCNTYPYTMYECELDNTSCIMLPFRYTGEGEFGYLEINEKTKEVGFYISPASGGNILAYSYGEHPRCYVEGCEILEDAK